MQMGKRMLPSCSCTGVSLHRPPSWDCISVVSDVASGQGAAIASGQWSMSCASLVSAVLVALRSRISLPLGKRLTGVIHNDEPGHRSEMSELYA